jgi:hypothetical protein
MSDKQPTQGERIEALEQEVADLKASAADIDKIKQALASGDPTLIAATFAD